MLTDRQNKFFNRMTSIKKEEKSLSYKEERTLDKCINSLKDGRQFKHAINDFNLSIRELKKKNKLINPRVNELYKDLIEIYGEPGFKLPGADPRGGDLDTAYSIINL